MCGCCALQQTDDGIVTLHTRKPGTQATRMLRWTSQTLQQHHSKALAYFAWHVYELLSVLRRI